MGWLVDVVNYLGIEHAIIFILVAGLSFAYFAVWRMAAIVRGHNKLEVSHHEEVKDLLRRQADESRKNGIVEGEVLTLKQMLFRKRK